MFDAILPWCYGLSSQQLTQDTALRQISFSNLIFLAPFSQLQFGLTDCMILIKDYVSLKTTAMEMGKRHFYSDHSNAC